MTPPSRPPELRIVVADDHPVVLAGVRSLIEAAGDMIVVGEAGEGRRALRVATELRPDVMVLDLSMPGLDGQKVAMHLRETSPGTKILVHTAHEDKGYLRQALELGVRGYILKRSAGDQLVSAIRSVAQGGVYIDPSIAAGLLGKTHETDSGASADLSERENAVLKLVAAGYVVKEIAARIGVSAHSVENYKARGMKKLGLETRVDLVRYAMGKGWLDAP